MIDESGFQFSTDVFVYILQKAHRPVLSRTETSVEYVRVCVCVCGGGLILPRG